MMRRVRIHVSITMGPTSSTSLVCTLVIPWEIMVMTLTDVLWHGHGHGIWWAMRASAALVIPVYSAPSLSQRIGSVWSSLRFVYTAKTSPFHQVRTPWK
eukprot:14368095-Heterocapsa_arctica.AAC.1